MRKDKCCPQLEPSACLFRPLFVYRIWKSEWEQNGSGLHTWIGEWRTVQFGEYTAADFEMRSKEIATGCCRFLLPLSPDMEHSFSCFGLSEAENTCLSFFFWPNPMCGMLNNSKWSILCTGCPWILCSSQGNGVRMSLPRWWPHKKQMASLLRMNTTYCAWIQLICLSLSLSLSLPPTSISLYCFVLFARNHTFMSVNVFLQSDDPGGATYGRCSHARGDSRC